MAAIVYLGTATKNPYTPGCPFLLTCPRSENTMFLGITRQEKRISRQKIGANKALSRLDPKEGKRHERKRKGNHPRLGGTAWLCRHQHCRQPSLIIPEHVHAVLLHQRPELPPRHPCNAHEHLHRLGRDQRPHDRILRRQPSQPQRRPLAAVPVRIHPGGDRSGPAILACAHFASLPFGGI